MSRPFEAKIYCGSNWRNLFEQVEEICQKYVNKTKWCVSVTKTRYIYPNGAEDGVIVGIIYYPRFPLNNFILKKRTLELATCLMKELNQKRVTIMFNDSVKMLENKSCR